MKQNYDLISHTELVELTTKANNPSIEKLKEVAKVNQFVLIPTDEHIEMKKQAEATIQDKLEGTDWKLIKNDEYDELLVKAHQPTIDDIARNAAAIGFGVMSVEAINKMKEQANESIYERSSREGMVVMSKEQHDEMREKIQTPLAERAKSEGYALIKPDELQKLRVAESRTVEDKALAEGKVAISEKLYNEILEEKNMWKEKYAAVDLSTGEEHTLSTVKEKLEELGFSVIPKENSKSLPAEKSFSSDSEDFHFHDADESFILSEHELSYSASRLGLVLLSKEEYNNLNKVDEEKVKGLAKGLSLTVIPESEVINWKQSLAAKDEEIHKLNLEKEEQVKKVALLENEESNTAETPERTDAVKKDILTDKDVVVNAATKLALLPVPESQYVGTTAHPRPDVNNVKVVPTSYFNQLLKLKAMSIEKCSDDVFKQYAEKRGYVHRDQLTPVLASTTQFKGTPVQDRDSLDSMSRITPPINPAVKQRQVTPVSKRSLSLSSGGRVSFTRGLPESNSVVSRLSEQSVHQSLRSQGMFSMATDVSFTDRSMIPAITQVVIGEYLFKYYRRLGAFKVITETRHERYFWVHPYSLTLYWTENNPILSNSSSSKTRAAAIVSVESVEDNNPLPTGLYYKSIIVHSTDRSIKITCATRHRHNIWYNALRYLVNRNINDLVIDEDTNIDELSDEFEVNTSAGLAPAAVKSESHRNLESLMDTGDRRAYPRPKRITSSPSSPASGRLSRFSSMRRI
ncbi:conserved hypothetical protein [Candida albicans WO-1]|uniref:PH domain-containing protein n=1 Tax=Candida albicans (strain WO-1) TaxID=294748 RepID=C4YGN1_CANAW|nr:conserved hypothetical protein [Candida albicans WO-1]